MMPGLVWNNLFAVWICLALVSLAVAASLYFDTQRAHDTAWRATLAASVISVVISVFMLLYDISIWLYIH
jgi:Kef-type K+ transport system membrane component KefB